MNPSLKRIVPNDSETYNISHDAHLSTAGIEIMNWLLDNNKMKLTHSCNGVDYRWVFGTSGKQSIDFITNNLPKNLRDIFDTDVIDYLGIRDFDVNEIKFEIIGPNEFVDDIHLKRCRFGEIVPVRTDDMSTDYQNTIFYSLVWHTDKSFELNNYKVLVYLNDIDTAHGGLMIADPVISPSMVDNKCVLHEVGQTYKADQIKEKEITGSAGTCASFNSHILHRANLPKQGYRYCMHLSFLLPDEKHRHAIYSKNHID